MKKHWNKEQFGTDSTPFFVKKTKRRRKKDKLAKQSRKKNRS